MQIMTFIVYGSMSEILDTADSVYNLYFDNFQHCGIEETFKQIQSICASSADACSVKKFAFNAQKNWLSLVSSVNGIMQIVTKTLSYTIETSGEEDIYQIMFDVGSTSADVLTAMFDI